MEKNRFSFKKGWSQIKIGDAPKAKEELMVACNNKTRAGWGQRLRGEIIPRVTEAEAIEKVFAKYGVKKDQVWGE